MKQLIIAISILLSAGVARSQNCYSYTIPKIEGGSQQLSALQNKMILVITLPVQQTAANDSLLHSLDSLGVANGGTLQIIAVPSYEDGFTAANKTSLKTWYRSILNTGIVITDGLYTRKTSGSQQHAFFQWLTSDERNGHFNNDVTGPRMKYFIWTDGILTGVLSAASKLNGPGMVGLLKGE